MPRLLYLSTEDWAFCQHFLPMLRTARDMGIEVRVAAREGPAASRITAEGASFSDFRNSRRSLSLLEVASSINRLAALIGAFEPDIVHCVNIRMALLGSLAAKRAGFRGHLILAPTGLGHLWIEQRPAEIVVRTLTRLVLRHMMRGPRTHYLFENLDDPKEFGLDPHDPDVTIVHGAGVDPVAFPFSPGPEDGPENGPVRLALVARMLRPKGILEAVHATRRAISRGAHVELHLYGTPDPGNRRSFTTEELQAFAAQPGIFWHGQATDPAAVYRAHHIAILLSYREGLPKALVEAAAIGRPIIASNVPGCREVIEDGKQGFLVPLGDIDRTADAICRLAADKDLRQAFGAAARQRFEARFTEAAVMATIGDLYRALL